VEQSRKAQFLADGLDPRVRVRIAFALSESMRGRQRKMTKLLRDRSLDTSAADPIGRSIALAHVLHLNRQGSEALAALDDILSSKVRETPEETRLIIEQNRAEVCFGNGLSGWDELERHYGQIDRRHVLGITLGHADAILDAGVASQAGRNYDSLPVYNSLLFETYRSFDWHQTREAAEYLCRELLRLGEPVQAAFCAVLSESKDAAHLVANHLRALNDSAVLAAALEKITETARLSRHVTLSCHFLDELGDAIPDRFVAVWIDRLGPARRLPGVTVADDWVAEPAWKATSKLLHGASLPHAQSVVEEVLRHPRWATSDIARLRFYEVLEAAVSAIGEPASRRLVKAVVPHVTASPPGHDFRKALRLLTVVVDRWPSQKAEIRKNLFRRGRRLPHLLVAAASFFEQPIRLEDADNAVNNAIQHLQLQVERLAPGVRPSTGQGESLLQTKTSPAGSVVVKVNSCAEELNALIEHRKTLNRPLLGRLVRVIIKTLSDPENVNANRVQLFRALGTLSDSVDSKTAREMADSAARYAENHRAKVHPLHGDPEDHAPLNPFRVGLAWPQEVRGEALLAIAQLCRHHPRIVGPKLVDLILAAVADSDPSVRRSAYHAVHLTGDLAGSCLPATVGGIRDNDAPAANVALQVVGLEAASIIKAGLVPTVVSFIEGHSRHPDVGIWSASAAVIGQILVALGRGASADTGRLNALADRFRSDVSRSVRDAMSPRPNHGGDHKRGISRRKPRALTVKPLADAPAK